MPIPKHTEIRIPVLEFLKKNGSAGSKEMVVPLSEFFRLNQEEVNQMYESGNGPVFKDRISWALTYLKMAGLIEPKKRGLYVITQKGNELLATPEKIDDYIDEQQRLKEEAKQKQSQALWNATSSNSDNIIIASAESDRVERYTPQEKLYQSYENIRKSILDEILDMILSKSPREFEKIVVALLQKMGYGGEIKDSGLVTQATNDQGIDGIIKEDVLGLGRIHIQAKKYARDNGIGREDIQKFVGALAVAKSNKGVFITTSYYTKGAIDYANSLNGSTNIVLINGDELAEYIYKYDLGMQTEQVITIKKLDSDFWDEMEDH